MTDVEVVLLIAGAWCVLLGVVVSLLAVASRAEERFDAPRVEAPVARRPGLPDFTQRRPERELPGRKRPATRTGSTAAAPRA
jgi:hypothetical protein